MSPYTYKLSISDPAVGIAIVSEHVLHHVVQLVGIFVQDLDQGLTYLLLLEIMVLVGVELGKDLQHPFPYECSKTVI